MKHLIIGCIITLLLSSCSHILYDIDYRGENNYKAFYLVDTISINMPVRIYSKRFGGMFVMSSEKLKKYRNDIDFFLDPNVFLLGYDLYRDLDNEDYYRYRYPDNGGCHIQIGEINIDGLEIYDYPKNTRFILGLINANYYHIKHNSSEYFNIPIRHSKITYLKMVYPLCQ
jgi:hypothetical protein